MRVRRSLARLGLGLVVALISSVSSAGVIYNWKTLSTSAALTQVSGQLEISNSAWRRGILDVDLPGDGWYEPGGPIERFFFQTNGVSQSVMPGHESPMFEGVLQATLTFPHDDTVNGTIYANNTESEVALSADNGIWRISEAGSDSPAIGDACYNDHAACTATGQWLVDPASVPVTEPTNFAVFALALAMIGISVKRRSGRQN